MKRIFVILFAFALTIGTIIQLGCKVSAVDHDFIIKHDYPVVIIDGTTPIMATDLYLRLANSNLLIDGGILDTTTFKDTLQAIVLDSVLSLEATKVDLKKDLPLYHTFESRYFEFYINYLFQHLIQDSISYDSLDVIDFAAQLPEKFAYQEQVRARQITISAEGFKGGKDSLKYKDFSDEGLDSIARELIHDIKHQIDTGAEFGYLAFTHSVHRQSGDRDGDLGYFKRYTYSKEFEEVAFSQPVETVSEPFESPDGWHIIEVFDHIDSGLAIDRPEVYAEAARQYIGSLGAIRAQKFMDSLKSEAEFVFNEEALQQDVHQVPDTTWGIIINKIDTINYYRMEDFLHRFKSSANVQVITVDFMKDMLLFRAQSHLLRRAGDELGFSNDSAAAREYNYLYHKYAVDLVLKGRMPDEYRPPDSLVEQYYNLHKEDYVVKKPLNVQHIIAEDSLFAEFLRDQALSGVDFLDLAKEHYPGAEEIRVAASDLGFIGPGELPDEFYAAALRTGLGSISTPVKTEWGFHIIKVLDKKFSRSLEQVRPEIEKILTLEYKKEFVANWNQAIIDGHDIVYDLEPIRRIELESKDRR